MPISVSRNQVGKPHGTMQYNVNVSTDENPEYYPLQIKTDMPVFTSDGRKNGQETRYNNVGTSQSEPFDFSTIEGLRVVRAALPTWMKAAFTALVIDALDEDPST